MSISQMEITFLGLEKQLNGHWQGFWWVEIGLAGKIIFVRRVLKGEILRGLKGQINTSWIY